MIFKLIFNALTLLYFTVSVDPQKDKEEMTLDLSIQKPGRQKLPLGNESDILLVLW